MSEKIPKYIYLQHSEDYDPEWGDEMTWCEDRIHDTDIGYIRMDAHEEELMAAQERIAELVRIHAADLDEWNRHTEFLESKLADLQSRIE
jgi:hypothetical protein